MRSLQSLRAALAEQDFERADDLTAYLIRPDSGEELIHSDEELLRTVDQLWSDASDGRFGLVVQARLAPDPSECLELAGIPHWWSWFDRKDRYYAIYDLTAPRGHLPMEWLFSEPFPDMDNDRCAGLGRMGAFRDKLQISTYETSPE